MGRKPRVSGYGAIYHVIARGNNREAIFLSDRDTWPCGGNTAGSWGLMSMPMY